MNLTSYLDSSHKVSQYLLIHSKAVKAKIKEIKGKNTKSAILIPQFDPWGGGGGGGGGAGGKSDLLS